MDKRGIEAAAALAVAAGTFAGDQLVKSRAKENWKRKKIRIGKSGRVLPEDSKEKPVLTLQLCENPGMAMSTLSDHPQAVRALSAGMTGIVAGGLVRALRKGENPLRQVGLSLVLGGALSNTLDRFRDGAVTDYVSFSVGPKRLQKIVFNIGDFAILAGAAMAAQTIEE